MSSLTGDTATDNATQQAERKAYNRVCIEPIQSTGDPCTDARNKLNRQKQCLQMREGYGRKWYNDSDHEGHNEQIRRSIKNHEDWITARKIAMVNSDDKKMSTVLNEYAELPEYSEMGTPSINTKSLFGNYPINIAATRGMLNEVITILSHGADVNAPGEHNYSPLHNAIEQGHIEVVQYLINYGANLFVKTDYGDTPAQLAKKLKEQKIFELLQVYGGT